MRTKIHLAQNRSAVAAGTRTTLCGRRCDDLYVYVRSYEELQARHPDGIPRLCRACRKIAEARKGATA